MKKPESYPYVGPRHLQELVQKENKGHLITNLNNLSEWIKVNKHMIVHKKLIATFVINENQELLIADRHSEHIACAEGKNVLAAGEITFSLENSILEVSEVTNQSTGYCPKPDSWTVIDKVLDKIRIIHPKYFTVAFKFRYCTDCQSINLIKEEDFTCIICGAALPRDWNFGQKI